MYGVMYTAVLPRDERQQRAAKLKASSAARQELNLKHSWQKLEVVTAANFSFRDMVITLTYDNEHLPPSTREAVKLLKKFLTQLKGKSTGRTSPYGLRKQTVLLPFETSIPIQIIFPSFKCFWYPSSLITHSYWLVTRKPLWFQPA